MPKITPNITKEAKEVYDNLPKTINKSIYVSEAIIEKKQRESGTGYITQEELKSAIEEHENRYHRKDG